MSYDTALAKINALRAMVVRDSVSPAYLAGILDEILAEFDNLDDRFSNLLLPVSQELGRLAQADQLIADDIAALQTSLSNLSAALESEAAARASADSALSGRIDSTNTQLESAIEAIQTVNVGSINRDNTERTEREAADTALAQRLSTVESVNSNQDTAISYLRGRDTDTNTRIDDALARLDVDEATIEAIAEDTDTLSDRIDTEISDRSAADTALAGRIDSAEAVNTNQDTAISYLRSRDTATNSRIDDALARLDADEGNIEAIAEITDELSQQIANIQHPVQVEDTDDGELVLATEDGTPLLTVAGGHVRTENFDSTSLMSDMDSKISAAVDAITHPIETEDTDEGELVFADEQGSPLLTVTSAGHIRTEAFDSAEIEQTIAEAIDAITHPVELEDTDDGDLVLAAEDGTPLLTVGTDGHVRTGAFDSANLDVSAQVEQAVARAVATMTAGTIDKLAGKKWVALGDSFTADSWGEGAPTFADGPYAGERKVYPYYVGRRTGINVINMAVGGMTLATGDNSVMDVYQSIPADADYITVYIGINDSHQSKAIGAADSTDPATFAGAYNTLLAWLVANRPYAHLGVIVSPSSQEANWSQYDAATRAAAKRYGVPVLDIGAGEDVPYFLRQTLKPGVSDSVRALRDSQYRVSESNHHPNERAHELQSHIVEQFLRRI